jgi:phosphoribosylformylglycinamidine cyclo-ligase
VRKLVEKAGVTYETPAPFEAGKTMGDVLLAPTRIYVKPMSFHWNYRSVPGR